MTREDTRTVRISNGAFEMIQSFQRGARRLYGAQLTQTEALDCMLGQARLGTDGKVTPVKCGPVERALKGIAP